MLFIFIVTGWWRHQPGQICRGRCPHRPQAGSHLMG